MKRTTLALIFTIALATAIYTQPAAAQFRVSECTNEHLRGSFGFFAVGSLNLPSIPLIDGYFAHVGKIVFDGQGRHVSTTWVSYNGLILEEPIVGPYTVNRDCSVTFVANLPPPVSLPVPFRAFLSSDLLELTIMPISPGSIVTGKKRKQQIVSCSTANLRGSYALQLSGQIVQPPERAGGYARTGRLFADGAGGFSAVTSVSNNGLITEDNFSGTYTLGSDCILTLRWGSGPGRTTLWGAVIDGGDGAYLIQLEPQGTTNLGSLSHAPRR